MLVTVVADDGTGDLAVAEARQRCAPLLPEADVAAVPVPVFDAVSAGERLAAARLDDGVRS